jgi:transposase-like protein
MTMKKKHKTRLLAVEAVAGDRDLMMRCDVHFLRNALDSLPRKADDDCLQALRWIFDRRDIQEAQRELAAWISQWQGKYPKRVDGVETNIGKTTFYRPPWGPPQAHEEHERARAAQRGDQAPTRVMRIFPVADA